MDGIWMSEIAPVKGQKASAAKIFGQTEKNSVRAYVFRSSPNNGRWFSTPQNIAPIEG
jgi:hypothetical protein